MTAPLTRRSALQLMALAPAAAAFGWTGVEADRARQAATAARAAAGVAGAVFEPQFFDAHEWRLVRLLCDMILPADERSGSATDAGVPEFIDFMMMDQPARQTAMRGGLAWIDAEARRREDCDFADCTDAGRAAILDAVAWPARARPEDSHGVAFFNSFRDLVATGFWSSRMGVEDLEYKGNTFVPEWTGCPPAALQRLGVRYDD
jgi:gluconate 2-dehydrogenase gamma chain